MATLPFSPPASKRYREPLTGARLIIVSVAVGFAIFILWAMLAKVDEVTAGQGKVIPSSKVQLIQSPEPATVQELLVRSGQRVRRRASSWRCSTTRRTARSWPKPKRCRRVRPGSPLRVSGGSSQSLEGEEATLSAVRRQALSSRVAALGASAEQRRRDAAEANATINSLQSSLALAQKQVEMMEPLAAKNIVPQTELMDARREVIDLQGRIAAAREQAGRANAAVGEALSQANEARFTFRQDALNERSQVQQKIAVNEQSMRGQGQLGRMELRSPVDGVVKDVQVTTIGGFVQAGEKVMEVVPMGDKLLVETRVKPSDIAFIKVGDKALVKVTAYDFSTYGGLDGRVVEVSADSIYDEVEREAYFIVIVETDRALPRKGRPTVADHARHDDRHADHHWPQERAQLFTEAGPQSAQ